MTERRYSVDTSSLIRAWEWYPPDLAPRLWPRLVQLGREGIIRVSEEVHHELKRKSDELCAWLDTNPELVDDTDEDLTLRLTSLLKDHPTLMAEAKGKNGADPWVICLAERLPAVVVTEESAVSKTGNEKIPNVCQRRSVECIGLQKMLRERGITLG